MQLNVREAVSAIAADDPARDRTQEGSGLGLAIVKRAAEQMGGTAWAELPPDGGLRIVVTLKKGAAHE